MVNNAVFKEMVINGPKNKTEESELKPDFCFSFQLLYLLISANMDPDVTKFMKTAFSRVTSLKKSKENIMKFSGAYYGAKACNTTTRTL